MKITSGRCCCRYSRACSADSAVSTASPCCSSMRLRITLAERESSTIRARLPVVIPGTPWRTARRPPCIPAFYLDPAMKPIPANASGSPGFRGYASVTKRKDNGGSKCPTRPRTSATSHSWAKPARARHCWPKPCSRSPVRSGPRGPSRAARPCATSILRKRPCSTPWTPRSADSSPRAGGSTSSTPRGIPTSWAAASVRSRPWKPRSSS